MDFKGITWVGNIYQKFEAMCLEVEEAMYEDTVKYMESQAHNVGGSVKKFYSEIMQDLLPQSCIGPEHDAASDYLLNSYGQIDVNKKPRLSISDAYGQLKKNESEDVVFGNRYSPPPIVFVESIHSDGCSKKLGAYRRPVGIRRVSRSSNPTKACADVCDRICSIDEAEKNRVPISSEKVTPTKFTRKLKGGSECVSIASERLMPTKTTQKKAEPEFMAPSQYMAEEPNGGSAQTHAIGQVDCEGTQFSTSNEDNHRKESSCYEADLQIRIGISSSEPPAQKLIIPFEDNLEMEVVEKAEVGEPGTETETFTALEMSKLEETCFLVEAIDYDVAPQGTEKPKPYKKKIREALVSKLRHKKKPPQRAATGKSPPHGGSSESEWELL